VAAAAMPEAPPDFLDDTALLQPTYWQAPGERRY
jgi:hypothetical protein